MTKNITLKDYVKRMTDILKNSDVIFKDDNESKHCKELLLSTEAKMLFLVFGKEISQKIQQAFDLGLEAKENEEYYKVLVIFFVQIGSENTRQFLGYLSMAMREKDEG